MPIGIPPAVPVVSNMRQDMVPICVARPENPGIANVLPMTVTVGDSGMAARINGGGGACLWVPPGHWIVRLTWKKMAPGDASAIPVDLEPGRTTRLNICVIPRDAVRSSWTLKREGEPCAPQ